MINEFKQWMLKKFPDFFTDAFFVKNRHEQFVRNTELGVHVSGLFGRPKQADQASAKLDNTPKYTK